MGWLLAENRAVLDAAVDGNQEATFEACRRGLGPQVIDELRGQREAMKRLADENARLADQTATAPSPGVERDRAGRNDDAAPTRSVLSWRQRLAVLAHNLIAHRLLALPASWAFDWPSRFHDWTASIAWPDLDGLHGHETPALPSSPVELGQWWASLTVDGKPVEVIDWTATGETRITLNVGEESVHLPAHQATRLGAALSAAGRHVFFDAKADPR